MTERGAGLPDLGTVTPSSGDGDSPAAPRDVLSAQPG